jgi:hypothetical protein
MARFDEKSKGIFILAAGRQNSGHHQRRNQNAGRMLCGYKSKFKEQPMNRIIYIVGLVVIVIAILSFIGIA